MLKSPAPESKHPLNHCLVYKNKAFFDRCFASPGMLRRHFVLVFLKISRDMFGDFATRDPAFASDFSRPSAILKIVEEKALVERLRG